MNEKDYQNDYQNETPALENAAKAVEESQLDKPITLSLLLKFGLPTIFALLVLHTFAIVDGIFAMRVLSWEAMSAITVFMPFFMITAAIGMMFAAGGSAVIVKKTGMKLFREARRNFTFICIAGFVVSISITVAVAIFPGTVLGLLGVNYEIYDHASAYLRIAVWAFPFMTMGQIFNIFLIADGKPMLGMGISVLGTVLGAGGNAIFLFVFGWGMEGLAWATLVGTVIPVIIYLYIFCTNRKGTFYFALPSIDLRSFGSVMLLGMAVFIPGVAGAAITLVLTGIWMAMPIAEGLTIVLSMIMLMAFGKRYHFLGKKKMLD